MYANMPICLANVLMQDLTPCSCDPMFLIALEVVGYDIELAGAWLLGKDAAVMVSSQTNTSLEALLSDSKRQRLVEDMARAMRGRDDALEYSHRLLEQFTIGFTA